MREQDRTRELAAYAAMEPVKNIKEKGREERCFF